MMNKKAIWNGVVVAGLLCSALAQAEVGTSSYTTEMSARSERKLGASLGLGDPSPAVLGINVHYNVTDYLRASLGYGNMTMTTGLSLSSSGLSTTESSMTTIGGGLRAMMPGWVVTPTAGLHFAMVNVSGGTINGFSGSGSHVYGALGVDYQAKSGFNASLGLSQSFRAGAGNGFYLNLGWFFDYLG